MTCNSNPGWTMGGVKPKKEKMNVDKKQKPEKMEVQGSRTQPSRAAKTKVIQKQLTDKEKKEKEKTIREKIKEEKKKVKEERDNRDNFLADLFSKFTVKQPSHTPTSSLTKTLRNMGLNKGGKK